jgi:molybdenum cofactor cytidylyltransferase
MQKGGIAQDDSYDPPMIPAIVLAAGQSSRMGRPKANLPASSHSSSAETFLSRIVRTFQDAQVEDVVVVVGGECDAILEAFSRSQLAARFVENPDPLQGQLSSLLVGLRTVDRPGVVAALVTLVDVPFFSAATVRAVVDRYLKSHERVVRPSRGSEHGHPFLIDRALFDVFRRGDAAAGAKPIVRSFATRAGEVEVDDAGAFTDVDTPDEYARALRMFGFGGPDGPAEERP